LISAARRLLANGVTPTVEGAAAQASVSRTTAYRYFPNRRALLVATYPRIEQQSLLGPDPPSDPMERLEIVAEDLTRHLVEYEPEYRAQLRLALEDEPAGGESLPLRRGRRIGWIEDALAPLSERMPRFAAFGFGDRRHARHRGSCVADRRGWALPRGGGRGDAHERPHAAAVRARPAGLARNLPHQTYILRKIRP
jgi:AcrR family transcriptional regulator